MADDFDSLPPAIVAKLMSLVHDADGETEVIDRQRFLDFVKEYGGQYPVLWGLVKLNEGALREHFERTGEVPPGIKLIKTTTQEGDNVTRLEIFWGGDSEKPEE